MLAEPNIKLFEIGVPLLSIIKDAPHRQPVHVYYFPVIFFYLLFVVLFINVK